MNISHKQLVKNLFKPGQDILNTLTPVKCNVLHAVLGLASEIEELRSLFFEEQVDVPHVIEEVGDCLFYIEALQQNIDFSLILDLSYMHIPRHLEGEKVDEYLTLGLEALLTEIKAHIMYAKPLEEKHIVNIYTGLYYIKQSLQLIIRNFDITIEECKKENIAKLLKRYPTGSFSDTHAKERLDKQEEPQVTN